MAVEGIESALIDGSREHESIALPLLPHLRRRALRSTLIHYAQEQ
jgi:hypothetical protein